MVTYQWPPCAFMVGVGFKPGTSWLAAQSFHHFVTWLQNSLMHSIQLSFSFCQAVWPFRAANIQIDGTNFTQTIFFHLMPVISHSQHETDQLDTVTIVLERTFIHKMQTNAPVKSLNVGSPGEGAIWTASPNPLASRSFSSSAFPAVSVPLLSPSHLIGRFRQAKAMFQIAVIALIWWAFRSLPNSERHV